MKNPYANIPVPIWLIVAITLISRSSSMVLIFLPLYLGLKLKNIVLIGEVISLYGLGEIIGSYLGGIFSDKFGLQRVQAYSFFIVGTLFFLLSFIDYIPLIMIGIFFAGLFTAAARPATSSALAKFSTPETRAKAYALNYQAMNLGGAIGPIIGGMLASMNYSWIFMLDGAANIVASFVVWLCFRKYSMAADPQEVIMQSRQTPWGNSCFLLLLLLTFFIGFCFFQVFSIYPLYLASSYHLNVANIGYIIAINGLLIILFQMPITAYLKKFSRLKTIGIGGLLISLGYFILPFGSNCYFAMLTMIIITLGEMIAIPLLFDFASQIAPSHQKGQYLGLLTVALMSGPLLVAPTISSYLYHVFSPVMLWRVIGLLGMVIFIGFRMLHKNYPSRNCCR